MTNDESDTVVIGKSSNNAEVYHTHECHTYPENPREISREEAQRRGLTPCKPCHGRVTRHNEQPTPIAKRLEDMDPSDL